MGKRFTLKVKPNHWLMVVLLGAAAIRVIYLILYSSIPEWEQLTVDNYFHHNWAQIIAGGNVLGDTTYFRAPFYMWCLGLLYFLFGASLWTARLFGLAVGLASVFMSFVLGRRLFDEKTGAIAAAVHAVCPILLYFESELLLDPLFTLLLQVTLYRLIVWLQVPTDRNLLSTGLAAGLAAITRPTILVLVPLILFLIVRRRESTVSLARSVVALILGLAVVIGPVFVRNVLIAGDPVLIASQGGINFYIGNNESSDGCSAIMPLPYGYNWKIADITFDAETAMGRNLKPGEVSDYWYKRGIDWAIENPLEFTQLYFAKLYYHFGNREISNNRNLPDFFRRFPLLAYNPLTFGLLFALAIAGVFASWRKSSAVTVTIASVLVICAAGALFFFSSRFRMPIVPLFIIFATAGGLVLFTKVQRSFRTALPYVVLTLLAGAFSYFPVVSYRESAPVISLLSESRRLYSRGQYDGAIDIGRLALRLNDSFPDTHLNIGAAFFRKGMADSARSHFETEMRQFPGRVDAYSNLGSLYLVSGDVESATETASKALELRPYDLNANLLRLRAMAQSSELPLERLLTAIDQSAEALHDNLVYLNEAGALLIDRREYQQAFTLLNRAIESSPPPIETDDRARASGFADLPHIRYRRMAKTYYHLGLIAGLNRRYDEANKNNRKAIERDPDMVEAYINLAAGYIGSGQRQRADSLLQAAAVRFPGNQMISQIRSSLR